MTSKFVILIFFSVFASFAQGLPQSYESYESRPDILTVTPHMHPNLVRNWDGIKWGHLEAIAQMIEMFPEHHIYFLARDGEQLYDFARLALAEEPKNRNRIHLLNVSRINKSSNHIEDYLAQEGISEATLSAGKKVLFVDTGIYGSIPYGISSKFPPELRENLQTKLLSSKDPGAPSTRVFLGYFDPNSPIVSTDMQGEIFALEELPRFTDRSTEYLKINDTWQAVSPRGSEEDGVVNRLIASKLQQDFAAFWHQPKTQAVFKQRRGIYRRFRELALNDDKAMFQKSAIEFLRTVDSKAAVWFHRAVVEDVLDILVKNFHFPTKGFSKIFHALKKQELAVHAAVRKREAEKLQGPGQFNLNQTGRNSCKAVFLKSTP